MKILHVVRQFYPAVAGMENTVLGLCQHLQQRGHQCDVVTLNRTWSGLDNLPAQAIVRNIRVFRLLSLAKNVCFLLQEFSNTRRTMTSSISIASISSWISWH